MTATILYIIIGVVMTCAGIAAYIAYIFYRYRAETVCLVK